MMMETMHTRSFARPVAFLAEESGYLRELAHTGYGVRHKFLRYSNNYGLDWEKLDTTLREGVDAQPIEEVAVILTASSSSDLWLHKEHGPVTRKLCQHLRSKHGGLTLRFIVRPTTTDAKKRWDPSTSHTGIFHEFLKDNGPPVLIWRADERSQGGGGGGTGHEGWNQHTGLSICELTVEEDVGSPDREQQGIGCGYCFKGSLILLVLMAMLIITSLHAELQRKITTLQDEVTRKNGELNESQKMIVSLNGTVREAQEEILALNTTVSMKVSDLNAAQETIRGLNDWADNRRDLNESSRSAASGGQAAAEKGAGDFQKVDDHPRLEAEDWFPKHRKLSEFKYFVPFQSIQHN